MASLLTISSRSGKPAKPGTPGLLLSPNSVLANALLRSIDILRPRVLASRPSRIEFVVGARHRARRNADTDLHPASTGADRGETV